MSNNFKNLIFAVAATVSLYAAADKPQQLMPSYAWGISQPLGLRYETTIDTLPDNYGQRSIPGEISDAYACTGNLGAEGRNMLWVQRPAMSDFFFLDGLSHWIPSERSQLFYNTRTPMTLLSYNTGGGRETTQDRLAATFSGNINAKSQVGALLDYLYSKGSYANQAAKGLNWGFSGSYIGDRYEFQGFFYNYNHVIQENGGITDALYITDPALVQGGVTTVDPKAIPTNLSDAFTRIVGRQFLMNHRYKIGYWHEDIEGDSVTNRIYVPVTSLIYTLNYKGARHIFHDGNPSEALDFFENTYLTDEYTRDNTTWWSLENTFGISLLEGFHRYAKFGLGAFVTYEIAHFGQVSDPIPTQNESEYLTPYPFPEGLIPRKNTEHNINVGGQLTKQHGSILRYNATAKFGISGRIAGDVRLDGELSTYFPLLGDSIALSGFASFHNTAAPYLAQKYISNHFVWSNDFGKERTLRFGGNISSPRTGTNIRIEAGNIQNLIYFGPQYQPLQNSGSVQLFSASLSQNLKTGILHWDNRLTYQTSSDQGVMPMPEFAVYSNLYIKFKVATLFVQLGVDCDYYTKYYAPAYQPATASFANQSEVKCGNYPFMNAYANFKLSKTRFYVMYSHFNKGIFGGNNYFSMPLYPLNPSRFQLGLSVDFAN